MEDDNRNEVYGRVAKNIDIIHDKVYTVEDLRNIFKNIQKLDTDGSETQQTIIEKINAIFDAFIGGEE